MSDGWRERARAYCQREGFLPILEGEYARHITGVDARRIFELEAALYTNGQWVAEAPPASLVAAFYDALLPVYDVQLRKSFDVELEILAYVGATMEALAPAAVTEAGCGTGLTLGFLAVHFPRTSFIGYDVARVSVEMTNARLRRFGCRNVTIVHTDHVHAPERLARGAVDLVLLKGVLQVGGEGTPNTRVLSDAFAAFRRILKRGGVVLDIDVVSPEWHQAMIEAGCAQGFAYLHERRNIFPFSRMWNGAFVSFSHTASWFQLND